jgi:hypothetical protein
MSFVEYDSVDYATRALHDLYGHTLGGLVKGGIRLSYSKNPLVRPERSPRGLNLHLARAFALEASRPRPAATRLCRPRPTTSLLS